MKIAVLQRFLPSRSPGGVGYFTHGLCNALVDRGHQVTVFSLDPAPPTARYRVTQLVPPRLLGWGTLNKIYGFPLVVAQQDFSTFDLIHAQGDDQWLPRRRRPPLVRTFHGSALQEAIHTGWHGRSLRRFLMFLSFYGVEHFSARHADLCVGVSMHTRRDVPRVQTVIPNGVDVTVFRPTVSGKSAGPAILFVGLLDGRKRGTLLLRVFRTQIRPRVASAELWLVCPQQVSGEGIRWYGQLPEAALADLYRRAWVLCSPSSYEGFGRPYLEALASGTVVVATPNAGACEVLENGRYGVLVSDDRLGHTLVQLLTDRPRRQGYEARGVAYAQSFAWDRVVLRYEEVYRQALARPHSLGAPPPRGRP